MFKDYDQKLRIIENIFIKDRFGQKLMTNDFRFSVFTF